MDSPFNIEVPIIARMDTDLESSIIHGENVLLL